MRRDRVRHARREIIARGGNSNSNPNFTYMPLMTGKNWHDHNIEQEASMIEDRFVLHIGYPVRTDFGNSAVTLPLLATVPGIPHA